MMAALQLKEGEATATVYSMIKDQRYNEAVQILNDQLQRNARSRAALSLLGYCYYQQQDFVNASDCYEQLTINYPEVEEYKLYYAQSLYKACLYAESMKVACQIDKPEYQGNIVKMQAAIKYGEEDFQGAKSLVEQCPADDPDTEINLGCLLFKENRYDEACQKFMTAMQVVGYKADLSYNIALCHYMMKQYAPALKHIADIIEKGIREHPELSVGMTTEGIDVRSVGNTLTLHETALIEAFNLKAAIEYQLKNYEAACEALTDMPPRSEEELDAATLHNQALMNMETSPTQGFEKFQFLLQQNPFPPETFGNLLLLYIKYEYYDLAADVLAENMHLTDKYLTPYLYHFLEAVITRQTSPEEAYRRLDEMASQQTEILRKLTKQVQEARQSHDDEAVKKSVNDYDEALERYIPILMQQAKIYWDMENYQQVEKVFRKSVEFCNENDVWKLNVAHVLFMQENKFKEATGFYEPIVKKNYENILSVSAIVLANLCVSYIMTSQNEEAEELMRKIEKEEEQVAYDDPDKKIYHLCIVNLVIGTLYCAKGNYEFGISRVIKSLEPYNKKLGTDTWFYAKRCFLSMIENMAKHMIMIRDGVIQECIQFLEHCEVYGRDVKTIVEQPLEEGNLHPGKTTATYEARLLKDLLLDLIE
ncbi:tetratricopeptide repeat protein 30A [Lingula anatina]|uniref:Tetratricopeptide repeat protein 30 n=1 Tax=Lingula anatina TaxID=7574 RepID=A0A1S3HHD2_LINAN|nr:tetratricopeptide repeat protein 30A [Lingula anatina]|eukprot:XP_013384419.1 tetratricopeptide repeat protein 30A [Lingula anatina]